LEPPSLAPLQEGCSIRFKKALNTFNAKTPRVPFCEVWMMLGPKRKVDFHLVFLKQLANPVAHHIQLASHFEKSPSFFENIFYNKNGCLCIVF
jgi:hypothetical protein